ncbi:hypothetical protein L3Q82_017535, partial [Scortum barcoo]
MSQSLAEVCADFNRVLQSVQPNSEGSQITKQRVPLSQWAAGASAYPQERTLQQGAVTHGL